MKSYNSALAEASHCLHLAMTVWGAYCFFKLQVITIKLSPDYKYWWLASFFPSLSPTHTHTFFLQKHGLWVPPNGIWGKYRHSIFTFSQTYRYRHISSIKWPVFMSRSLLLFSFSSFSFSAFSLASLAFLIFSSASFLFWFSFTAC